MNVSRADLKWAAKQSLQNVRPHPMLVTLVYLLIPAGVYSIITLLTVGFSGLSLLSSTYFTGNAEDLYAVLDSALVAPAFLLSFLSILLSLLSLIYSVGFTFYGMKLARGQAAGFSTLFEGFTDVSRVLLAGILTSIFTFLWSMLFFFPGIVAAYRYRMTFRILKDHPDISALTAISMSKEMMYGHKLDLFILDLSFIGWLILSSITFGIVGLWVYPYQSATEANFYDALQGWFPRNNAGFHAPPVGE